MGQSGGQLVRFVKFMWVFFSVEKSDYGRSQKKKEDFYMKTRKVFHTQFTTSPPRRFHLYARVPKTQLAQFDIEKKKIISKLADTLRPSICQAFCYVQPFDFRLNHTLLFWLFRLGFSDIWRSCVGCHLARCFVLDEKTAKHAIHSRYEHENEKL